MSTSQTAARLLLMMAVCHQTLLPSSAQYKSDATYGVKAGADVARLDGVGGMLVSEGYYSGYSFRGGTMPSVSASIFLSYRVPRTRVGLEARMSFDALNTTTTYTDVEGFTYDFDVRLRTLGASAHVKCYVWRGLYLSAGFGYGWSLTPCDITYTSNSQAMDWGDAVVPGDSETASELSESFSAGGRASLPLTLGYELPLGLSVEAFYARGLNDVLTTHPNRYDFGDTDNSLHTLGLLVGWGFAMDAPDKHRHR